jgi:hypothetical protein
VGGAFFLGLSSWAIPLGFVGDIVIFKVCFILCKFQHWSLAIPSSYCVFVILSFFASPSLCVIIFYLSMQYLHPEYSFSHLVFCLCFLISDVVVPPPITLEGVHWAMDGPKFAFKVDGRDASYMAKYNLVGHLRVCHNVTMELGKLGCPST